MVNELISNQAKNVFFSNLLFLDAWYLCHWFLLYEGMILNKSFFFFFLTLRLFLQVEVRSDGTS